MFDFDLMIQFSKIRKGMQKSIRSKLEKYNITSAHAMFLAGLYKMGELSLKEITELVEVDKAQTTRIISDLKSKGYIYDDKQKENSRKYKIYLTEKGKEIAKIVDRHFQEYHNKIVLSEEEKKALISIRDKVLAFIDSLDK